MTGLIGTIAEAEGVVLRGLVMTGAWEGAIVPARVRGLCPGGDVCAG